jgi:hypothetical protein
MGKRRRIEYVVNLRPGRVVHSFFGDQLLVGNVPSGGESVRVLTWLTPSGRIVDSHRLSYSDLRSGDRWQLYTDKIGMDVPLSDAVAHWVHSDGRLACGRSELSFSMRTRVKAMGNAVTSRHRRCDECRLKLRSRKEDQT